MERVDFTDGLLLPARAIAEGSILVEVDAGDPLKSNYSQIDPVPGPPTFCDVDDRLVLLGHFAQMVDYEFRVVAAGAVGLDRGVEVAYRLTTETTDEDYRVHAPANVLLDASPAFATLPGAGKGADVATIPSSQIVVAVESHDDGSGMHDATFKRFDPLTWSWGAQTALVTGAEAELSNVAVVVVPEETVLAVVGNVVYYSRDEGLSFDVWSRFPWPVGFVASQWTRATAAYAQEQLLYVAEPLVGADTLIQLASSDLGGTFQQVETITGIGSTPSVCAHPDGVFVLAYTEDTLGFPSVRVVGSAFESFNSATETVLKSVGADDISVVCDEDGVLWVHASEAVGDMHVWRSIDKGATWVEMQDTLLETDVGGDELVLLKGAPFDGSILFLYRAQSGHIDEQWMSFVVGGWSNVSWIASGGVATYEQRQGTGGGGLGESLCYLPIDLPGAIGWVQGSAGVFTEAVVSGELKLTTTVGDINYFKSNASLLGILTLARIRVESGPAGQGGASPFVSLQMRNADGTDDVELRLNFGTAGYTVRDEEGAVNIGTGVVDMTTDTVVLVKIEPLGTTPETIRCSVWHRKPGATKWTRTIDNVTLTSDTVTPGAVGQTRFGHFGSGTAVSYWNVVNFATAEDDITDDLAEFRSKPMNSRPIPIPDNEGVSAEDHFRVSAENGPGRINEKVLLKRKYTQPVTAIFPQVSPSPSNVWRAAGGAEQTLVFDLGFADAEVGYLGDSIGLFVANTRSRFVHLEYRDLVAGTWVLAGTLDLAEGFSGLGYDRTGRVLVPSSSTIAAGRYLFEQQATGGFVILDGAQRAVIDCQTAGGWVAQTTVKPRIELEAVPGGAAASGTMDIVMPAGYFVKHFAKLELRRFWRVRFPAQVGAHGAGLVAICRLVPFGCGTSWQYSQERIFRADETVNRFGTTSRKETGPGGKRWVLNVGDGVDHRRLREGPYADYVAPPGAGLPLGGDEDILYALWGYLQERRSGEYPVIALADIPKVSGSVNDSTAFLYGRPSFSYRGDNVSGDIGRDEIFRIAAFDVAEIV